MKKLIIAVVLAVTPFVSFAQTNVFDKFQNVEGIQSICLNSKLFEIAGSVETPAGGEKAQKCLDMVKNIDNMKIFSTSERKHKKNLSSAVWAYLKENTLSELVSVNDKGSKVKVYVKQGGKPSEIREALVFVEDDKEVVVMSFTGQVDLNTLKKLK